MQSAKFGRHIHWSVFVEDCECIIGDGGTDYCLFYNFLKRLRETLEMALREA